MTIATKPVTRETAVLYRARPLIVTLHPRYLEIREKGRRDAVSVDYETIYQTALKLRWRREQAEKQTARKKSSQRRGGR